MNGICNFCGKRSDEVFRLVSSDGCKICNECVGRCADMIAAEYQKIAKDVQLPPKPKGDA